MIIQVLHCPYLAGRGRTLLLDDSYAGQAPEVKEQIIDMAMHARGIRDTARVLKISASTVISELKNGSVGRSRHL